MSENETPIERAVELLVYAPIGLAMFAKDTVPTFMRMFVSRGQTEVTKHRKTAGTQANQYRTIGQLAVKFGGPEVKRQAEAAAETVRKRAEETLAGIAASTAPPPGAPAVRRTTNGTTNLGAAATPPRAAETIPTLADLPIPGYDLLSASQVIERLTGLARPELFAVRAYETAHRARTTILGKISQLTA